MEHERCEACRFDGARFDDDALLGEVRALGPRWNALLHDSGAELRVRPAPGVWSALEYAAHSRDVTALHAFGIEQALTIDEPVFPAIEGDQLIDEAAATYADLDPNHVGADLDSHARRLAQLADDAPRDQWTRGLTIGEHRSDVRRLVEHALHDSVHHLDDVERGLKTLRD
jgi:hypothetical protein